MNVSATSDIWSLYNYAAKAKQNSTTDSSNDTSTTAATQTTTNTSKTYSGLDNAAAQAFFASMMSQGVLPASSTSISSDSDSSSTSTTAASSSDSTSSSTTGSATLSLFDFLTKVKNGTVTDADLTTMKSELSSLTDQTSTQQVPPPPPEGDKSDKQSTDATLLTNFLQKVENGTVTDADLTSIQSLLTQGTSQNDSSTTSTSASDSTTAAAAETDSSTSSSTLSLKNFLQKIKDGTVTDSDLSTMKSELASLQGEFSAGLMSPPPAEQSSTVNDTTADRTQSVQSTSSLSEQLLYNVSEAYLQNSYISNQNDSLFSTKS